MTTNPPPVGTKITSGWLPNGGILTQLFGVLEYIPSLGINQLHHGIDVGAKRGDPVQTPVHGVVQSVGYDAQTGAGNFIIEQLDSGETVHLYHLQDTLVKTGQDLSPGTLLGHVDSTGNSTGDHLHFEVQQAGGTPVDPWRWLSEIAPHAGDIAASVSASASDPCAGKTGLDAAWCQLTQFPANVVATSPWGQLGNVAAAAVTPRNLWRTLFVSIGVVLIGTGVVIYFFQEETSVVKVVAPIAAAV
jgi:hypothetical protein